MTWRYLWANRARWIGNESGQIGFGGGGTQQRKVAMPAPSAAETQAGAAQGQALGQIQTNQAALDAQNKQLYGGTQQAAAGNMQAQIQAGGLGTASPQQLAQIQQMFANPTQQAMTALLQAGQNSAASRGMSLSDSPVNAEYMKQVQLLQGNIAGQEANAGLQYGQQALQNNMQQANFGQNLAQAAQQNRMQLAQGAGAQNQQLFGQRLAAAPQTSNLTQNPTYGGNVGQLGGLAMGGAQAYNAYKNPGGQQPNQQPGIGSQMPSYQPPQTSWFNS